MITDVPGISITHIVANVHYVQSYKRYIEKNTFQSTDNTIKDMMV